MTPEQIFFILFHVSNLMSFLAFLLKDQMQLRLLMAASLFLQALYHFAVPGGPQFDPLFWKVLSFIANVVMILLVFGGMIDFGIPKDLCGLYSKISVLAPGQFRRLIRNARRISATGQPLIVEGSRPTDLFYLLRGEASLNKGGTERKLQAGQFLGEIAFLNASAASGTVTLDPEAEAIAWNADALKHLMQKDNAIDIAMRGTFNHDLAEKVANSLPVMPRKAKKPQSAG